MHTWKPPLDRLKYWKERQKDWRHISYMHAFIWIVILCAAGWLAYERNWYPMASALMAGGIVTVVTRQMQHTVFWIPLLKELIDEHRGYYEERRAAFLEDESETFSDEIDVLYDELLGFRS